MSESNSFLVELAKNNPIIAVFIGFGIAAFAYMEVAKSMASDVKTKVNTPTVSVNNTINNNIDVSKPKPETLYVKPETIYIKPSEITKIKQETVYVNKTTPNISTNPRAGASNFKELHTTFKLIEKETEHKESLTGIRFLCNEASDTGQDAKFAMIYPNGEREAFELKRSEQHLFSFKNVKYRLYVVKVLDGSYNDIVELSLDSVE